MNISRLLRFLWLLLSIGSLALFFIYKSSHILDSSLETILFFSIILFFLLALLSLGLTSVPEYEQYVIFRTGRCVGVRGPGPTYVIPFLENAIHVDLRVKHKEMPSETCITRDNIRLDIDIVLYWRIKNPIWSVTKITNLEESLISLITALLRAVIAHFQFSDVLYQRESINDLLKEKIDEVSTDWGVQITTIEIREIRPPDEIIRSMHQQIAAEWKRKATVIEVEGEVEAQKIKAIAEAEAQVEARRILKTMVWEGDAVNKNGSPENQLDNCNDVFIVHGHDELAKESVARLIEKLGLNSVVLHEKPNKGMSIIEKFENNSNVGFAIVLLTPDDLGTSREDVRKPKPRARQNVIFELGYFIAKLGRQKVCALYKEDVEIPSDYQGVLYIPMDSAGAWRFWLAKEIKAVGLDIDLNKV